MAPSANDAFPWTLAALLALFGVLTVVKLWLMGKMISLVFQSKER